MIASGEEILEYIPQRPPVVMVDCLISVTEKTCVSGLTIHDDNLFVSNGKLREAGLVENMAQSAALSVGYLCKLENRTVPTGFIGAVKNLMINELPETGRKITTTIRVDYEVMDASLVHGEVLCEGKVIASCDLKIFLKSN
jgi:predicted hotdog family 3-hydroxylacyl-ACP dehydratase